MIDELLKHLEYCIDVCGMTDEQTGEFLGVCLDIGVSPEYFNEEFLVLDSEDCHNDEYLNIAEFNCMYWEQ
jgi:hypothetical protein